MAANGAAIDLAQEGVRGAEKRGVSSLGLPAEKTKWEFLGAGGFFSSFPFHWGRFDSVHSLTKNR